MRVTAYKRFKGCKDLRSAIPAEIRAELLLEVGFRCPIPPPDCDGWGKTVLEFHHIEPWSRARVHEPQRMIAVCPTCHYRFDREIDPEFVVDLKRYLNEEPVRLLAEPNILTRLHREGSYFVLDRLLRESINYVIRTGKYTSLLPGMLELRIVVLRKLGRENLAVKTLAQPWYFSSEEAGYRLSAAKAALEFSLLNWPAATRALLRCRRELENARVSDGKRIFQINWRLAISGWHSSSGEKSLDELAGEVRRLTYPNDEVTFILASASLQGKCLSPELLDRIEQIGETVVSRPSLSASGFEAHSLAELGYLASEILSARGRPASAEQWRAWSQRYFEKRGAAKHSRVFELPGKSV